MNLTDDASVIIDTDIGFDIDDAYALALAIKGGLQISCVSTVSGNTIRRARIAKKMLVIAGKGDVPVFAGKESSATLTHGRWVGASEQIDVHHDIEEMIEHYWHEIERPRVARLQIVAIGPLSNIAIVRDRDEAMFDDRVQLLMMGGQFKKWLFGMRLHMLEYNIMMDRSAARAVLASRLPIKLVPFDVTTELKLTGQDMELFRARSKPDALIRALMEMTSIFHSTLFGHRAPIMYDPATVSVLLDPSIFSFKRMSVKVTQGGFTRVLKRPRLGVFEKEVCTALDMERFYDLFFTILVGVNRSTKVKT
jgi:purine nucleosidase